MRDQLDLIFICHTVEPEPRPLALRWIQMQPKRRASSLENFPNFLQQLNVAYDATVIHVPLIVHWGERCNLVHEAVDATAKIERPSGSPCCTPARDQIMCSWS